ncbi:hypothetical protein D1871_09125 [Nakamurella silvestris]|nr:hypothetical protein D1871_09125 [Nakamurella silvestris]
MPPRRKRLEPAIDVDALRAAFTAGKVVRIGIAQSSQFPEGGVGRVRAVGDPAVDGEEYIQVEVNVGGGKDTVPFSPADLVPVQRGKLAAVPPPAPEPVVVPAPVPDGPSWANPERLVTATKPAAAPKPKAPVDGGAAATPAPPAKPARAENSRARGKRAPVTITISTNGEDNLGWQVHAQQGSRTVVKATAVAPVKAWELVSGLGNADLTEFVAGILAEHRANTEAKAARLAEELAAIQAELAGYPGEDA